MSFIRKLFGGRDTAAQPEGDAVEHNGFSIVPAAIKEAAGFRVAANISKTVDGTVKSHQLIRADICPDANSANNLAVMKAKQLIDFEGEQLFE